MTMPPVDRLDVAVLGLTRAQADLPKAEERARQVIADARAKIDQARAALHAAIVAEYQAGARVGQLATRTGYNRETIRRVLRAAGVSS